MASRSSALVLEGVCPPLVEGAELHDMRGHE